MAVILGIILGAENPIVNLELIQDLALPCTLILKALRTLATPLIFLAIIHTFLTAEIPGKTGLVRMTLVFISVCLPTEYILILVTVN